MGKSSSYLRFNPNTREIELEGSAEFIKAYFDKLQRMLPRSSGAGEKGPETAATLPAKRSRIKTTVTSENPAPEKVVKLASKKATAKKPKKVSQIDKVVGLVQNSETEMTTADLQDKTGMIKKQIWALANRAVGLGRIKTAKRGVYVPV